MTGTGARRRIMIAAGIWREGDRLIAETRIGNWRDGTQGRAREVFPLGTDVPRMQAWQHHTKGDLLLTTPAPATRGSLAADVPTYLATLPDGKYKRDTTAILAHWIACPVGTMRRHDISRLDVIAQIARWTDGDAAAGTCNKRLSRLRNLYRTLDGVTAPNPTDAIKFLREPEREPRDMPIRIVRLILDSLIDRGRAGKDGTRPPVSDTKLRLSVIAWTGIAPATLIRVRPRDLDLKGARIYLRPRRKGKGSAGAWVALLPPAVDALRAFVAAGLVGRAWSASSMRKTWHTGIARATAAATRYAADTGDQSWVTDLAHLPPHPRPYDLRHAFGAEIYRTTGDIRAVSELLQHATLETTKRYTKGAVSERVTAAIAAASATYTRVPTLPAAQARPARGPRSGTALRMVRTAS
jgi:integrase